jgi:rubredoxin
MEEEIRKKLEQTIGRRSFLRGSGLVAAALVGAAAASSPIGAFAQDPPQQSGDKKKDDDKKKDPYKDPYDTGDNSGQGSGGGGSDPNSENKIDAQGREYRTCPQCGFNMYRQGRTWTCENCGYSYVE